MEFYHMDRRGFFTEEKIINLYSVSINGNVDGLEEHAKFLFPNGLSKHGNQYLNAGVTIDSITEWFFEYVRRSDFNNRPSRFESIFAFNSIEDLRRFKVEKEIYELYPIYKLQSDNFFKADMNLVGNQSSPLVSSFFAHNYWSGKTNEELNKEFNLTPLWEYLLTGKIKVLKRIE